jgi:hypothetical protein
MRDLYYIRGGSNTFWAGSIYSLNVGGHVGQSETDNFLMADSKYIHAQIELG